MERHGISAVEDLIQDLITAQPHELSHIYNLNLPESEFEWLQLLVTVDTVFIHEFLLFMWLSRTIAARTIAGSVDMYFSTFISNDCYTLSIRLLRDLMLMGNQIPMSFLLKLIETFPSKANYEKDKLEKGLLYVIKKVDPFKKSEDEKSEDENFEILDFCQRNHLLDCLYVWVLRKQATNRFRFDRVSDISWTEQAADKREEEAQKITISRDRLRTASQLSKAGIRFRAIEGGSISVMHYNKRKLRLDLPRLVVKGRTEDMLRNLIAHEHTCKEEGDLTKYAVIMDSLIDTAEDVAILTKAQVIENHLGSDERLLKMWNDMCINISDEPCERWDGMIKDVLHHYHSPWRAYYVEFREKYFSRPWLTLSLLAASLLLLFTLVQTLFTVIAYYRSQP